jgi:hypothetical protein
MGAVHRVPVTSCGHGGGRSNRLPGPDDGRGREARYNVPTRTFRIVRICGYPVGRERSG